MERQGNSRRTLKAAETALLIMLMGILACAVFAVAFYLIYEVVVGSRDYATLPTDIPGRAFDFCYNVAAASGCLPIAEGWDLIWLTALCVVLFRAQSQWSLLLNFYLLSPLPYMVKRVLKWTTDTPLLQYRNEEQCCNRSPGAPAAPNRDATRRSPCGTPDINLNSESSSCSSSASPLPQDGEFRDFPPATPGPSRAAVICDQDSPGGRSSVHSFSSPMAAQPASSRPRNRSEDQFDIPKHARGDLRSKTPYRTSDISRSSDDSMSFDSPVGGQIVPMAKGKSNKPLYISYSSILNSSISSLGSSAAGMADDEQDSTESQDSPAASGRDTVALAPANDTGNLRRTHSVGVRLTDYPKIPSKWIRPSEKVPQVAGKIHKRNLLSEKRVIKKQTQGARRKALEDSQLGATSSAKESDGERSTDNDHSDPPESGHARLPRLPPKVTSRRWRSRTKPGNFSRRCQFIPVHKRSASHRCRQSAESKMYVEAPRSEDMKCLENMPSHQVVLDRLRKLCRERQRISRATAEESETRHNAGSEVEASADKNLHFPGVPGGSIIIQQVNKPDVEISSTEFDKPTDENSHLSGVPGGSTEIHRTDKPDDDISLTEFDETESTRDSDQS